MLRLIGVKGTEEAIAQSVDVAYNATETMDHF